MTVTQLPPARGGNRTLAARVSALEGRVTAMESNLATAVESSTTAANNTAEILAVLTAAKSGVSFVKRYGPRVFIFASGVMSAAGFGNPEVWKFISNFFG